MKEREPPAGVAYSTQQQNRLPAPQILPDVAAAFVKAAGKKMPPVPGLLSCRVLGATIMPPFQGCIGQSFSK